MKSQISRDAYQPERHYSGVYLQQGRMILDADWNELTDIQKAALVAALRDAVSGTLAGGGAVPGGAPRVGGLGLVDVAAAGDPPDIRIRPGALYVEGVPARLDAAAPVEVTKQADYPIQADYPAQSLHLYADVWERTVTALNGTAPDPADPDKRLRPSPLMDAALHGADTATRSQTLLQVKWCADSLDPLDPAVNPAIGDALLTLKLNLVSSGGDKCDPCASQVKADERLGNYLFRVEVHDYDRTGHWLTLKWSRDNGAEACAVAAMPDGFGQGEWLWEWFDDATERLLGNHFAANPKKLRGLIKATCTTPTGADEPKDYVRQWDGAIRINLDTGNLAPAAGFPSQDRGVPLQKGPVASPAPGRVDFSAGVLRINLEHLELTLATQGRAFVPGDYWLAPVREAKDASGDTVLAAAPPRGVRHHYLFLGAIAINRKLVVQDDAYRRRMSFPPLTDLTARDVGFSDHCAGLYAGARNVQEALDNLCAIDAADIAYPLPGCAGNTVRERLKPHLDPDGDNKLTVKIALDTLLCQLNAGALPYTVPACVTPASVGGRLGLSAGAATPLAPVVDKLLCEFTAADLPIDKTDTALCSDLQSPAVATVQDALRALCLKSGGCAVTVSTPEHLGLLLDQFAKDKEVLDLWLCLKAGTYPLGDLPAIAGKRSLRLSGEGPESVRITFAGTRLAVDADEVILENLALSFTTGNGQLAIRAQESRTTGCHFDRTSSIANNPAMISVAGRGSGACRLHWRGNNLYAQVKTKSGTNGANWAGVDVVGNAAVSDALLALDKPELLGNKVAYDKALMEVAKQIVVLPKDTRTQWQAKLAQSPTAAPARAPKPGTTTMAMVLGADKANVSEVMVALEDLVAQWILYESDWALRLETEKTGGLLAGNVIDGWLLLANGHENYRSPDAGIDRTTLTIPVVKAGGEELRIEDNRLAAIKANLQPGSINADHALIKQAAGYARLFLTGNSLSEPRNAVVAASFVGQGNTWYRSPGEDGPMGSVIAMRATFTGNLLEGYGDNANLTGTVREGLLASMGNVLIDLEPAH